MKQHGSASTLHGKQGLSSTGNEVETENILTRTHEGDIDKNRITEIHRQQWWFD